MGEPYFTYHRVFHESYYLVHDQRTFLNSIYHIVDKLLARIERLIMYQTTILISIQLTMFVAAFWMRTTPETPS